MLVPIAFIDNYLIWSAGELEKIRIGHDNKGVGSAWYLDRVTVRHVLTGRTWFFYSQSWYSS